MSRNTLRILQLAALGLAPIVGHATNVTACSSDNQADNGTNFATALAHGGDVFIRCPSGTRMSVTKSYHIATATQIIGAPTDSGSAQITLDGTGHRGVMLAVKGGKITIQNLRLTNFAAGTDFVKDPVGIIPGSGGPIAGEHMPLFAPSIIHSDSDVELDHVTIESSRDPVGLNGNLTVSQSSFSNNLGNTLVANGIVTVDHSGFSQNERGVLLHAGSIAYSTFDQNTTRAVDILFPEGQVTLRDSSFTANGGIAVAVSAQSSPNGGGSVLLRNNNFSTNSSTAGAFTITNETLPLPISPNDPGNAALAHLPTGKIQVLYNNFLSNTGTAGAMLATLRHQDELDLGGDTFLKNQSTQPVAAALSLSGGNVTISHTLFKANAGVQASAIAADDTTSLTISNSLFVENVSSGASSNAAAISATLLTLSNVTIANNQETGVRVKPRYPGTVSSPILALASFSNVIIDGNTRSCDLKSDLSVKGANLVFPDDHSCAGATISEDPVLDSFYIPSPGSPALAQGVPEVCAAAPVSAQDIVFQKRTDKACALGAFERPPPRFFLKPTPDGLAQIGSAEQKP